MAARRKKRSGPIKGADLVKSGTELAANVGAAKLAGAAPSWGLVAAAIPAVIGLAVSTALAWRADLLQQWWRRLCEESGKTFDEVKAEYEWKVANEPDAARVVADSVQAVLVVDPSVMPTIAALGYEYFEKKPDRFFRGTLRLLSDLDGEELRALSGLLTQLDAVPFVTEPVFIEVYHGPGDDLKAEDALYAIGHGPPPPVVPPARPTADVGLAGGVGKPTPKLTPARERLPLRSVEHLARLFNLLKVNDLATESIGRLGVPRTLQMFISKAAATRLLKLLR